MQTRFAILLLFSFVASSALHADIVVLRNGARIEGKIVGQNRQTVRINGLNGTQVINKANVRRIVYGPFDPDKARRERAERIKKQQEAVRKRQELIKKQQEAFRKRQEELLKQQQAETEKQIAALAQEEEAKREAARKAAEEAERRTSPREERTQPTDSPGGGSRWLGLLVPGLYQFQTNRAGTGSFLMTGALLALAGGAGLEAQRLGLVGEYQGLDEIVNLLVLNGDGGQEIDLLASLQRDGVATRINQTTNAQSGAAGLLGALYVLNAFDIFLSGPTDDTSLQLHFAPNHAGLAFQVRF